MKNNKHVESFGKFNENLNISDVSDSNSITVTKQELISFLKDFEDGVRIGDFYDTTFNDESKKIINFLIKDWDGSNHLDINDFYR
ncbi:MAG: hypothetical protein WDA02_03405 [Saccharofermentanales bacterium]